MLVTLGGLKDPYREEKVLNFMCGKLFWDQYQYLGNCPPTPPVTQQQSIDNKLRVNVGLGEGKVGSCPDTDIDSFFARKTLE